MNVEVSITEGRTEHLSEIRGLILEWGYSVNESQAREWLMALLESPSHQIWVAISDAAVVGWAVAERRISIRELFTSEITGLVVSANVRRAGVGRLLVQAVEDWSRAKGLSRVVVRSNVSRSESHGFYPSIGFEHTKTTYVYVKDLDGSTL
ncbi:GNAT family N-acetyltransferase [Marinobacter salarius]|jgi:GNAT superfamily N-acetyltransferase|uniref:GNAT family N-acetyltransferase n=1 Tax=Marinobacter salarius TaxID=1420917 RepID=UPI0018F18321|nr:GNAT family N-acetyltransferase [Marinobacter salarius]MBJ7278846.1 GNAT family N-acetyltransferase [Marinobacter salarius]